MQRHNKSFTVSLEINGRLAVFLDGKILYKLCAESWQQQITEWIKTGWEIIWVA